MNITAQLDLLSTTEKLQAMELLWDDLCRHADAVPSPGWHGEVLAERASAASAGHAEFRDWETEKQRIRAALK